MDAPSFDESKSNEHTTEASSNYQRFEYLQSQDQWGWAAVLLFYSALHLVEAYKCLHHPHIALNNHESRNEYVFDELRPLHVWYKTLYSMSRSVRYDLYRCEEHHLDFAHGDYNLLWIEMQKVGITY